MYKFAYWLKLIWAYILQCMANELQKKYEAQFLQASGFSFMIPLAKIILNAIDFQVDLNLQSFIKLILALIFSFIGMMLILEGYSELGDKWMMDPQIQQILLTIFLFFSFGSIILFGVFKMKSYGAKEDKGK